MKKFSIVALLLFIAWVSYSFAVTTVYTGTRATAGFPVYGVGDAGTIKTAYGTYDITVAPVAGDIYNLCKLPKNAVVIGGRMWMTDIDATTGTETLDIDIGWATAGTEAANYAGFLDGGVMIGDAVTGYKPEVGNNLPLGGVLLTNGTKKFTDPVTIRAKVNAAAVTFSAGTIGVRIDYFIEN